MKSRIITTTVLIAFVLGLSAAIQAQSAPEPLVQSLQVPFDFMAGGVSLPAGQYDVLQVGGPDLIMLRSNDGRAIAMVQVIPLSTDPQHSTDKLVFNKYGDKYFLSEVWTTKGAHVHQCLKSRTETALAKGKRTPEGTAIVAKR